MSWSDPDREDNTIYKVVINQEEQYSIWPEGRENPLGWRDAGKSGLKAECLAYVDEVWTDMRPLSLRKRMEEMAQNPPPQPSSSRPSGESLVERLCRGEHPVEVSVLPDRTVELFKAAIDRGYVHIKFTGTEGHTEFGLRLEPEMCDFSGADFGNGTGTARVVGRLTLDYVKVQCIANINLQTLEGSGHLEKLGVQD